MECYLSGCPTCNGQHSAIPHQLHWVECLAPTVKCIVYTVLHYGLILFFDGICNWGKELFCSVEKSLRMTTPLVWYGMDCACEHLWWHWLSRALTEHVMIRNHELTAPYRTKSYLLNILATNCMSLILIEFDFSFTYFQFLFWTKITVHVHERPFDTFFSSNLW